MLAGVVERLSERRRSRPLLGTRVAIRVRGAPESLDRAIDDAFARIAQVHRLMSFHDPASDVGRLNRRALTASVGVDRLTWTVLAAAQAFSAESLGAFDATVAPSLEKAGLLPPGRAAVDPGASWRDIELLDRHRVRFHRPLRLDLGGIAKGFAVDLAVAALRRHGLESGLVDAGGDMRAFGPRGFRIALRHPGAGGSSGWGVTLREAALASSAGGFADAADNRSAVALVDPGAARIGVETQSREARPEGGEDRCPREALAAAMPGIVVRAPTAMTADALTKVVLFAAPATCEVMLARHRAAAGRLVPGP